MHNTNTATCLQQTAFSYGSLVILGLLICTKYSSCYGAGVRRLTQVSQKSLHGPKPNFMGNNLPAKSPTDFQKIHFFFLLFVNTEPSGRQHFICGWKF